MTWSIGILDLLRPPNLRFLKFRTFLSVGETEWTDIGNQASNRPGSWRLTRKANEIKNRSTKNSVRMVQFYPFFQKIFESVLLQKRLPIFNVATGARYFARPS